MERPLLTGGLFFLIARGYTMTMETEVPIETQLIISSVLVASAYATEKTQTEKNPAVKSLTTGSLFAGAMYVGLGNSNLVLNAVLGTLTSYAAEVILSKNEENEQEEEKETPFRFKTHHDPSPFKYQQGSTRQSSEK